MEYQRLNQWRRNMLEDFQRHRFLKQIVQINKAEAEIFQPWVVSSSGSYTFPERKPPVLAAQACCSESAFELNLTSSDHVERGKISYASQKLWRVIKDAEEHSRSQADEQAWEVSYKEHEEDAVSWPKTFKNVHPWRGKKCSIPPNPSLNPNERTWAALCANF